MRGSFLPRLALVSVVAIGGASCKKSPPPIPAAVDAGAPSASASAIPSSSSAVAPNDGGVLVGYRRGVTVVDRIAVSSRVDNDTETPDALTDGNLDTAWSSKTGDLVGAWIALRVFETVHLVAIGMTAGMTKRDDLFTGNVRIAAVKITWAPVAGNPQYVNDRSTFDPETTLVESAPLDVASRELQKIPVDVSGRGILKITVTRIRPGTKPSWREATVSELSLFDAAGALTVKPDHTHVGSFQGAPRGIMNIIPESTVPMGCVAAVASVPRAWCFLGRQGGVLGGPATWAFETLDKNGLTAISTSVGYDGLLPYGVWLKAEHDIAKAGGARIPKSVDVPFGKSAVVQGATFRQRATREERASPDGGGGNEDGNSAFDAVTEVEWPGDTTFTKIFDETGIGSTVDPLTVGVTPLGSMLLVERTWNHGSEGLVFNAGEAVLCDVATKKCTDWDEPTPVDPEATP